MALAPPGPLVAQGHNRHLWPLGACRAEAPSGQDGGCLPGLRIRTECVLTNNEVRRKSDGRVEFAGSSGMGRAGLEPATKVLHIRGKPNLKKRRFEQLA